MNRQRKVQLPAGATAPDSAVITMQKTELPPDFAAHDKPLPRALDFAISLMFYDQVKAAAIRPLFLIARLKLVLLLEMAFSVRVHPAPFNPTPNMHAGIKL